MSSRSRRILAAVAGTSAFVLGAMFATNGCGTDPSQVWLICLPDADPAEDKYGYCTGDGGPKLDPAACGGECVVMGSADFRQSAVLLWMGAEEEQPACPERAPGEFYKGYGDLKVSLECAKCSCTSPTCVLPGSMDVDPAQFCQGANPINYAAPAGWDGSCFSPAKLPPGSFSSIGLNAATVSPCAPINDAVPDAPSIRANPSSFAGGVSWGKYGKACQGAASGTCKNANEVCLASSEPPPPGFRQCVQYLLPVDESNLAACPKEFPDPFVFYSGAKGNVECSACSCGDPIGAKCNAAFSAYPDTTCTAQAMSLFENVPSGAETCIDFSGLPYALGSMKAKWLTNEPGNCEPIGGQVVGEIKPIDPRLFCCQ